MPFGTWWSEIAWKLVLDKESRGGDATGKAYPREKIAAGQGTLFFFVIRVPPGKQKVFVHLGRKKNHLGEREDIGDCGNSLP